jgi:hypothetical protein
MALTANFSAAVSDSLRENFSDIITTIDPTETPIQANIAQTSIKNPEGYEWQIDSLNTQVLTGLTDGFAFADAADRVTTRTRLLARCMIQAKSIEISNRLEETDKAGVDSEISYQLALASEDLKRDCEGAITDFATPIVSASGTAPKTAGIPTWIRTNTDYGATGAAPTLSGKEPVVGTAGTARALDESDFLDLLGGCYTSGGNPDMVSLGVSSKQAFSQYMFTANARIATQYQDQGRAPSAGLQVVGAVDFYVSDFGTLAIVPNRFQAQDTDMLILDTSLFELGVFRGYQVHEMGLDGDRQRFLVLHDFCLISRDEAGSAIYADIDTAAAMTA